MKMTVQHAEKEVTVGSFGQQKQPAADATIDFFRTNNFDLIRLFAALQVAVFHSYHRLELPIPQFLQPLSWFQGVPIFFVISGYLISKSLERQPSISRYARNRALRIFPGLWACLAITAIAAAVCGFSVTSSAGIIWIAAQFIGAIYTPSFLDEFGDGTYNGSLWTIPLELQFYAVLPVLYWGRMVEHRRTQRIIICFAFFLLIACILKLVFPEMATAGETLPIKLLRYTFIPRFYLFMLGVVLQRINAYRSPLIRGKGLLWVSGYAAINLCVPQVGLMYVVDEIVLGVAMISVAYSTPSTARRWLRGNDISYGVYLYHGLVIGLMIELAVSAKPWSALIVLFVAIVFGAISWLLVERPAMAWKRSSIVRLASLRK
jgi:peptidoglycan/LPS O-acetylase OafA/YrhL